MRRLWGKLWFRIVAAIVATPVVMTASLMLMALIYVIASEGLQFDQADFLPPPSAFLIIVPVEYVMMVPPLIAVEIINRRHHRPLPPLICGLFLAVLMATAVGGLWLGMTAMMRITEFRGGGLVFGIAMLLACYVAAAVVSMALLAPLIRRWRQESRSANDTAGMF